MSITKLTKAFCKQIENFPFPSIMFIQSIWFKDSYPYYRQGQILHEVDEQVEVRNQLESEDSLSNQ